MTLGLSISNVSKTFSPAGREPVHALRDVSIEVALGEFVVLLGPSGCGKSTLLFMVAGLESTTGGAIAFDGLEVRAPGPERSLIFQEASLFPWLTVRENVGFGLSIRRVPPGERARRVDELLRRVGLAGAGDRHPSELSGGMRQRAALARALAMDPEVLLMDEPFAALDIQTRARMQDHLLEMWSSTRASVLLVTHSVEEALALADRIVVFTARPGRIKAEIPITAPRPRDPYAPEMVELAKHCSMLLREEVEKSFKEQELL